MAPLDCSILGSTGQRASSDHGGFNPFSHLSVYHVVTSSCDQVTLLSSRSEFRALDPWPACTKMFSLKSFEATSVLHKFEERFNVVVNTLLIFALNETTKTKLKSDNQNQVKISTHPWGLKSTGRWTLPTYLKMRRHVC